MGMFGNYDDDHCGECGQSYPCVIDNTDYNKIARLEREIERLKKEISTLKKESKSNIDRYFILAHHAIPDINRVISNIKEEPERFGGEDALKILYERREELHKWMREMRVEFWSEEEP